MALLNFILPGFLLICMAISFYIISGIGCWLYVTIIQNMDRLFDAVLDMIVENIGEMTTMRNYNVYISS